MPLGRPLQLPAADDGGRALEYANPDPPAGTKGNVMAQHFTRNTVSAQAYCPKCGKQTMHRVDDRRIGPCLECIARLEHEHEETTKTAIESQGDLFQK